MHLSLDTDATGHAVADRPRVQGFRLVLARRLLFPIQLDEHLAAFRWHAGSLTSANRLASLRDDFDVRMRHASKTPLSRIFHAAHYFVRRRRLIKAIAKTGSYS